MAEEGFPKFQELRVKENYAVDLKTVIAEEFNRSQGTTYVDHAAAALYSEKQIDSCFESLKNTILGNPHSRHIPSDTATQGIDAIRNRILEHFNTTHEEYDIIFTSGATHAIKIVAENFVWSETKDEPLICIKEKESLPKCALVYTQENHTSILGLREYANKKKVPVYCFQSNKLREVFEKENKPPEDQPLCENELENALFVYSGQCNFSGSKYDLSWIKKVRNGELNKAIEIKPINASSFDSSKENEKFAKHRRWFVLLDAASLVATSPLNLSEYEPDFVPVSFYKIFGYPTGLGCLLVHKRAWNVLTKQYFGGGTVEMVDSRTLMVKRRSSLHERFEDGTLPFLSILSLEHGFSALNRITGGFKNIEHHVFNVARYFHHNLCSLRHGNNSPIAEIYSENQHWKLSTHGPIVNFNILDSKGCYIGYSQVERVSSLYNIFLRTGCVCNPGACQRYLNITSTKLKSQYKAGHVCGDTHDIVDGFPTGSVRVSFGYTSTFEDADRVLLMIKECFLEGLLKFDSSWLTEEGELSNENSFEKLSPLTGISVDDITGKKDLAFQSKVIVDSSFERNRELVSLTEIIVYPIKSCAGIRTNCWNIGPHGLEYDRQWMIVTSSGITLTQKRVPQLSLVKPLVDKERKILKLSFTGHGSSIEVNINELPQIDSEFSDTNYCGGKVCGERVKGIDCGDEVGLWLSNALQMEGLRLIRQIKGRKNKLTSREQGIAIENLSLANESQYLVIHLPSIRLLNEQIRLKGIEPPATEDDLKLRFRPNLVFDGGNSYEEDGWRSFTIGGNKFQVDGKCTRCQMVCVSQETGKRSREPLLTLASTRGSNIKFGIHASYEGELDKIKAGVEIRSTCLDVSMDVEVYK